MDWQEKIRYAERQIKGAKNHPSYEEMKRRKALTKERKAAKRKPRHEK